MTIKVLIVDDQNVLRQGLMDFVGFDPDIQIAGTAVNGVDAVQKACLLNPDLVLMDLIMPVMNGIEATIEIKRFLPLIKILIITGLTKEKIILQAINAGADGYLVKTINPDELCRAIKEVFWGKIFQSPALSQPIATHFTYPGAALPLSKRQNEVLALVAAGKGNREISQELKLSLGTIKAHVSGVLAKLNVQSRTQAALYANTLSEETEKQLL